MRQLLQDYDRDFVAFFNALWYRDFPVTESRIDISRRALWTTHIASVVKQSADLMGLFTCFETGGKTDAVIEDSHRRKWAKVEWEWAQPHLESVNEITKLAGAEADADTFIFIGYGRLDQEEHMPLNLQRISSTWQSIEKPLLAFLITFNRVPGVGRVFHELETHVFRKGTHRRLRVQPALPWKKPGTKWESVKTQGDA